MSKEYKHKKIELVFEKKVNGWALPGGGFVYSQIKVREICDRLNKSAANYTPPAKFIIQ